ncbi:hypothetical protein M0811_08213 [Anaeramoeba ignava]|uniref:Chorein N-terminal domain-containing protein n=1 Tax=Anaeramoeba ignava TaxID=1746090 RepID=A0A9Q0LMP6_ANAIG|nr:hypothetical protein M0811_08213 [Anaeramoeba ignava]
MLKLIITSILNKYLKQYIRLNRDQLKIKYLQGDVSLQNIEIKKNALDFLSLPLEIKNGFVGSLHACFPWNNLNSEQTIIELKKVYIIGKPKQNFQIKLKDPKKIQMKKNQKLANWDKEKETKIKQEKKNQKLEEKEKRKQNKNKNNKNKNKNKNNRKEKLSALAKVNRNIRVSIVDFYLGYEGELNGINFSFGMQFDELTAESADLDWNPQLITKETEFINKIIHFKQFSIFCDLLPQNQQTHLFNSQNFLQSIEERKKRNHQYIIKKMDLSVKLHYKLDEYPVLLTKKQPKYTFNVDLADLIININKIQLNLFLQIYDLTLRLWKKEKYKDIPIPSKKPIASNNDISKNWWKYIFDCAKRNLPQYKTGGNAHQFFQKLKDQREYISLYKEKLKLSKKKWRKSESSKKIRILEEKLSYELIILFRFLAESNSNSNSDSNSDSNSESNLKDYSLVESIQDYRKTMKIQQKELPEDYEYSISKISLGNLQILLINQETNSKKVQNLISLQIQSFSSEILFRSRSNTSTLMIQSIRILDLFTKNTLYKEIIYPKMNNSTDKLITLVFKTYIPEAEPFYSISIDSNPLVAIYNPLLFSQILNFFTFIDESVILRSLQKQSLRKNP